MATSFSLHNTAPLGWSAMLAQLEKAEHSIDIEHFIFTEGGVGEQFIEVLARKAKAGVRVRLLIDAIGSREIAAGSLKRRCVQSGIDLFFFNSIVPLQLSHYTPFFFRDHQKLIVIDSKIGITGGVCIEERMRGWRDSAVVIEGDVVRDMQSAFDYMWAIAHKTKRSYPRFAPRDEEYLLDRPLSHKRPAYRRLRREIAEAKKCITIATPYFVPPHRLLRLLRNAARRGVVVTLLLPDRSDAPLADCAAGRYFLSLLEAGVRIYRYRGPIYHAKLATIDHTWTMVGSHNMDHLSFQYNFEGSLVSRDPALIAEVERTLATDLAEAEAVEETAWRNRPLTLRVKEFLVWPIHFFL